MDFKLLNFILNATIKDILLPLLKLLLVTHLEVSLLSAGTQVILGRTTLNRSYSLLTSKPSTPSSTLTLMLSTVVPPTALHSVMAILSMYLTTLTVTVAVMCVVVEHTTSQWVLMAIIQYSLMAINTFKLLKSKYT